MAGCNGALVQVTCCLFRRNHLDGTGHPSARARHELPRQAPDVLSPRNACMHACMHAAPTQPIGKASHTSKRARAARELSTFLVRHVKRE